MHTTKDNQTEAQVRKLIEVARHAPSVHNTQPWRFQLSGNTLQLFVDTRRMLHAGDPTTRELWISMGIMFEIVIQTAKAVGIKLKIGEVQTDSFEKPVATMIVLSVSQNHQDKATLTTIKRRHTYRGKLSSKAIETSILEKLGNTIKSHVQTAEILTTQNKAHIELASKLTKQGFRLAFSNTEFRHELSQLIRPNWTRARTGLPGFVLNKNSLAGLWEKWSIWCNLGSVHKAESEARRVKAAPLLLFIATTGDVPSHWFAAGRAYALTTLELTREGLYHSTIAAPIEAADYHKEMEAALKTTLRLQCMLIVGHPLTSEKRRQAPRLTVNELLTITH